MRRTCDCLGCLRGQPPLDPSEKYKAKTIGQWAEECDAYRSLVVAGDICWGRWSFDPSIFVLNHETGYQINLLRYGDRDEAVARWLSHCAKKRGRFDADDIGHLAFAFDDLFFGLDTFSDPIRILSADVLRWDLPEPMHSDRLRGVGGVYCVRAGDHVKIGQAGDIAKRMAELQTGSAHTLDVLAVLSSNVANERKWHSRFSHLRVRGEWFRMCEQIAVVVRDARWFLLQSMEIE